MSLLFRNKVIIYSMDAEICRPSVDGDERDGLLNDVTMKRGVGEQMMP